MTIAAPQAWLVIPNWSGETGFQHYRDRDPKWIKNHRSLLVKEEYLGLPPGTRALLHGLWLVYASSDGQVAHNTRSLSSALRMKVTSQQLKALNHAGFITVSASKPLALRYQNASPEVEKEKETPLPPTGKRAKQPFDPLPQAAALVATTGDIEDGLDYLAGLATLSSRQRDQLGASLTELWRNMRQP